MEKTEMQSLVEIQNEVELDIKADIVDEEYCLDIISKSNLIGCYGLYLAREHIHKNNNKGWEKFCKKAGINKSTANRHIGFYTAKSMPIGADSLPNKEGQFRALPGKTVDEKVVAYKEVKEITGKDEPTAQDITIVKKVKARGKDTNYADSLTDKVFEIIKDAPIEIKKAIEKAPTNFSMKAFVDASEKGAPIQDQCDIILRTKKKPEPVPDTCKEIREQNSSLRDELKKAQAEIDRLKTIENERRVLKDFVITLAHISRTMRRVDEKKRENDKLFQNMKPQLEKALRLLQLPTLTKPTEEELKRNYRQLVKKYHPDFGGNDKTFESKSNDMFIEITEAYKTLKEILKGEK